MTNPEPLPCPWCGALTFASPARMDHGEWYVACTGRGGCAVGPRKTTQQEAISEWNRVAGAVAEPDAAIRERDDALNHIESANRGTREHAELRCAAEQRESALAEKCAALVEALRRCDFIALDWLDESCGNPAKEIRATVATSVSDLPSAVAALIERLRIEGAEMAIRAFRESRIRLNDEPGPHEAARIVREAPKIGGDDAP